MIKIGIRTSLTKNSKAAATSRAGGTLRLRATVLALIAALLMTPAIMHEAIAQSSTAPVETIACANRSASDAGSHTGLYLHRILRPPKPRGNRARRRSAALSCRTIFRRGACF